VGRCRTSEWLNAGPWIGLVGQEQSECKHTHRCVLRPDCLWKEAGTFATLLCGKDESVREKGRETATGIVCCSEYTVHYLNTLTHSAYMLVGQSMNIPKLCSHHTSRACAFLVAQHTWWSQGVPRCLNCLSSRNRGHAPLAAGAH
jgi:hypothetical protein